MTPLQQELLRIFDAVTILSPVSFRFGGHPPVDGAAIPAALAGLPSHPLPPDPLVRAIQSTLYGLCYAHRIDDPAPPAAGAAAAPASDPSLPMRLAAANRAEDRWDPGWQVYQLGQNGIVHAVKGERRRAVVPGEYVSNGAPGFAPAPGAFVTLRVAHESHTSQTGFYYMFSETLPDAFDDSTQFRYYFHVTPECAPAVIDTLTRALNRYLIPYRMKVLNDPPLYGRTDAMVLYCARRYHALTAHLLAAIPDGLAERLGAAVPLFTRRFSRGIGVAEEPNTGESFGMNRCRLVAEGIVDAWSQGKTAAEARLQAVTARFELNGLRLDRPYLNAGSHDLFDGLSIGEAAA